MTDTTTETRSQSSSASDEGAVEEVSPGYLFTIDDEPARLTFEKYGLPEDFIEAKHPGDDEDSILRVLMGRVKQSGDNEVDFDAPALQAAFLRKCETQITDFRLTGKGKDGQPAATDFKPRDPSNNKAMYKKLLRVKPAVRDMIEGFLDEVACRNTPKSRAFANTGSTAAQDLAELGNV